MFSNVQRDETCFQEKTNMCRKVYEVVTGFYNVRVNMVTLVHANMVALVCVNMATLTCTLITRWSHEIAGTLVTRWSHEIMFFWARLRTDLSYIHEYSLTISILPTPAKRDWPESERPRLRSFSLAASSS